MQQLLVEVNQQDQIYVETECTSKGYTLSSFFMMLLNKYREDLEKEKAPNPAPHKITPPKRGRPKN